MVGGGVFDKQATCRTEKSVMPHGVRWIRGAVATFEPHRNQVTLEDGTTTGYDYLVVAPGIALDWAGAAGLSGTLGKNCVPYDHAFNDRKNVVSGKHGEKRVVI